MKNNTNIQNFTNILNYIFLACLGFLAFQSIFGQAIFGFDMASFSFGKIFLAFIEKIQYGLVVLAIVSGSLIFYVNREEIESIEEESEKELLEEEKRKKEFEKKFPVLNKVPLFGWIVKWMYKEGKLTIFLLFLIIIFGFFLRFYGLGNILPFSDEYTHLANVKKMYEGIIIEDDRGMFLNHTIKFLYDYFGYNLNNFFQTSKQGLFLARIPGVIISIFTIFILYLIGKELIGKRLGLLLAFLLAISPMNIEMAKFIREYIYFFFLLSLYILFSLKINIHKFLTKDNIIFSIFTLLILIFSFYIEPLSTLKVIIFFIFSTILALGISNISKIKNIFKYKKIVGMIILILSIIFVLFYNKFSVFLGLNIKYTWLEYFITNKKNYPSGLNNIGYLSLILVFLGSFIYFLKSKVYRYKITLLIILFTIFIIFYVFLFDRYIQIRYAYYVFLPFIILLGLGIYFIFSYITKFKIKYTIILLLAIFSIHTTLYSLNGYQYGKWNKITDHYIENYTGIYNKINKLKNKNNTIIITSFTHAALLAGFSYENILLYKSKDKNRFRFIKKIVDSNYGYIIIDWRRNGFWSKGLPRKDFILGNKVIQLVGKYHGIFLYKF